MKQSQSENEELPRRVLRRKKRLCYNDCLKYNQKRISRKRNRSWGPSTSKLRESVSLMNFRQRSRPSSASSLESVVCLGNYKKIPQLVVIESSSDDEAPQVMRRKLRKLRNNHSYTFKNKRERNANDARPNILHSEADLLHRMQEMHVGTTMMNTGF